MRFIIPIILIGTAIMVFLVFTRPIYNSIDPASPGITKLKADIASYNEALDNYKTFDSEKEKLTKKENSLDKEDMARLEKLLPDSVDNIRLILELEKIADPYGMVLRDVKYSTTEASSAASNAAVLAHGNAGGAGNDYGVWNLEFSTTGSYTNFLNFLKDIESNLRIVDVSSIQFSSADSGQGSALPVYKYSFKIKTYWLKN